MNRGTCPSCGRVGLLIYSPWTDSPICRTCLRIWYEAGGSLTPAQIAEKSRQIQDADEQESDR